MKGFRPVLLFCAALSLSGCAMSPPAWDWPDLTFEQVRPLSIDVAKIEVFNDFRPSGQPPHIEHLFKLAPGETARDLLGKQLRAAGLNDILRVTVEDASVFSAEGPAQGKLFGFLPREETERWRAVMSVRFELVDEKAPDIVRARARITARRDKTIVSSASPAERDRVFFQMTENLSNDLAKNLKAAVGKLVVDR